VKSEQQGHGGFGKAADSAAVNIAKFISEVSDAKIYNGKFFPEVKATFTRHVPYMSFPMNFLFGNVSVFAPLIKKIVSGIPAASAMLTTSVSFTKINAENKEAEATMYLRCIREDDLYRGLEEIKNIL
jgi:hypothetical protein